MKQPIHAVTLLAAALGVPRTSQAAGDQQAALIHLEAGPKVKPAEVEPLERALAEDLQDLGWTLVWAEPAVTNLAIGVDPKRCVDAGCRQKLAKALDARLVAGGKIDRRKDPVLGTVVDLSVWLMDAGDGKTVGEAVEHCSKCSASDVETAWLRALRAAEVQAGFVQPRKLAATPPNAAVASAAGGAPAGDTAEPEASGGGFGFLDLFDKRMLKWYAGGAGLLLGGLGVAYILIDGPRYQSCSSESGCTTGKDRQPYRYKTLVPGIGMVAGGAALVGGAIYLYDLERKNHWGEPGVALVPAVTQQEASVQVVLRW